MRVVLVIQLGSTKYGIMLGMRIIRKEVPETKINITAVSDDTRANDIIKAKET